MLRHPGGPTKRNKAPILLPGLSVWLDAFWEMGTERPGAMGVLPIPSSVIDRWGERLGVTNQAMFRACIRAMDNAYLDHANRSPEERQEVLSVEMTPAMFAAVYGKQRGA